MQNKLAGVTIFICLLQTTICHLFRDLLKATHKVKQDEIIRTKQELLQLTTSKNQLVGIKKHIKELVSEGWLRTPREIVRRGRAEWIIKCCYQINPIAGFDWC